MLMFLLSMALLAPSSAWTVGRDLKLPDKQPQKPPYEGAVPKNNGSQGNNSQLKSTPSPLDSKSPKKGPSIVGLEGYFEDGMIHLKGSMSLIQWKINFLPRPHKHHNRFHPGSHPPAKGSKVKDLQLKSTSPPPGSCTTKCSHQHPPGDHPTANGSQRIVSQLKPSLISPKGHTSTSSNGHQHGGHSVTSGRRNKSKWKATTVAYLLKSSMGYQTKRPSLSSSKKSQKS
ncbi:uncharacterized protein LOC103104048 [Monodelphis domestica]|uniref:uncharacterized protein LOC103104048 n=1 Tax=Monodelphis domestica TaxID=13616 RepID=UPI0024E2448E|nr:uncharacterized protein LOC103104048 [Monodelphis domestica]